MNLKSKSTARLRTLISTATTVSLNQSELSDVAELTEVDFKLQ